MYSQKTKRWYGHLVPSEDAPEYLFKYETFASPNLIICQETEKGRRYALFHDFIEFKEYFFNSKIRTFYEVIRNQPQKPFFDIDLDPQEICLEQALILVEEAIDKLCSFLKQLLKEDFCIQVFSSHSDTKISFHIIVEGVYLASPKQNKIFFEKFSETLSLEAAGIFDKRIYGNSIRQFRTIFSEKLGTKRVKIPEYSLFMRRNGKREWYYDKYSVNQSTLFLFKTSLITCISDCTFISFEEPKRQVYFSDSDETITIEETDIAEALELYVHKSGQKAPFKYLNIISNDENMVIVSLKRLSASYCPVCERVHQNENPFLIFWSKLRHVSFDCRRNEDSQRYYLGRLKTRKSLNGEDQKDENQKDEDDKKDDEREKEITTRKPTYINPLFKWAKKYDELPTLL